MWKAILTKLFKAREKIAIDLSKGDEEKPFLEHLEDLRTMLVRIAITLLVATLGTFAFNKQLTDLMLRPYVVGMTSTVASIAEEIKEDPSLADPSRPEFTWKMPGTREAAEGFMVSVNVSLVAGVIIAFPLVLLFLLQFILPGLRDNEKKMLWPGLTIGFGLFLGGVVFSFLAVLPRALNFFAEWNFWHGFENIWMLGDYITFSTRFILLFGISFELPVVVMILVKMGILGFKTMNRTRPHAIIGITVFSAVITPTQDILTLLLLAGPLYVLYEICIWLSYLIEKKDREAYPEYYADLDKDTKELEAESPDEWDKEDYNPWFSDSSDDEDEIDLGPSRTKTEEPPKPDATEGEAKSADGPAESTGDESKTESDPALPAREKTLEELAKEDEENSRNTD
jgi:Tat protein translocase TatC